MKATVKQVFEAIQTLNASSNQISSIGSYVSASDRMISESKHSEIRPFLPENSLAYKILESNSFRYSDKQLWVIAYELVKNDEYTTQLCEKITARNSEEEFNKAYQKAKLTANKAGSQEVLDFVKSNGRKLGDYYAFVKSTKKFAREFYSKKYTMESANEFLNN